MKLDLSGIKAVIFDMDGTMIDNTPFHYSAWIEFCKRHGITLTQQEYHQKISGKRNDAIFELLFNKKIAGEEFDQLDEEKEKIYRELYRPHLKEIQGLKDFLKTLSSLGIKLGVATTSLLNNRIFVLETLELQSFFTVVVGGEHVKNGKPHPEIYSLAAEKLGIKPENCLAFEDSPTGIKAAKSAGMKVVGVLTAHTKGELSQASFFVKNFSEIEIKD